MQARPALLLLAGLVLATASAQDTEFGAVDHSEQRQLYLEAQAALGSGRMTEFRELVTQLTDYPLLPYLQYAELSAGLARLPAAQVDTFLARYPDTVLAERLERQWLAQLVTSNRPADLIRYYNPANTSPELTCHVLKARLDSGDHSALDEVAPLWNVDYSQANACDPVFAAWIESGGLTPDIGWQRFRKTLQAGHLNLARYIATQLPAREQALAQTFLSVHREPERLRRRAAFDQDNPETREILLHGLQRLALADAIQAHTLLLSYASEHGFVDEDRLATERYILQRMLFQGAVAAAEARLREHPELRSEALVEWLLRDALALQDWSLFDSRLELLSAGLRDSERWRYWQARRLMQEETSAATLEALEMFDALAGYRSFYGFLAADVVGRPYAFVDSPVPVSEDELLQLAQLPVFARAYELYVLEDEANALREWNHGVARLGEQGVLAAGKLASRWGWHRNSIQAMIRAGYWDDLQLRFPVVYQEHMADAVTRYPQLDPHFIYAIVRQESAFMPDVRSPAGATGLMQLMPATARETARAVGMRFSVQDLVTPGTNIALGSHYLANMLREFDGNRVLAAAAYNAGPNRVRQWLSRNRSNMPVDSWIETIPFAETRGYVQNVLAYTVIYAHRQGESRELLQDNELVVWGR